jgi:hypothetical protein
MGHVAHSCQVPSGEGVGSLSSVSDHPSSEDHPVSDVVTSLSLAGLTAVTVSPSSDVVVELHVNNEEDVINKLVEVVTVIR